MYNIRAHTSLRIHIIEARDPEVQAKIEEVSHCSSSLFDWPIYIDGGLRL